MAANSGLLYTYDLLGLDWDSYKIHFTFEENSGVKIMNYAAPSISGELSSVGGFHTTLGTGLFSGQSLTIKNGSGCESTDWTQIFLYSRSGFGSSGGVLFDSFRTGSTKSGYAIGINDANSFYFQSFDNEGELVKTSRLSYADANCAAVVKTRNLINFYKLNPRTLELESDSHTINGDYVLFSDKMALGSGQSPFKGNLDEYVFISEGLNPSSVKMLMSGLLSDLSITASVTSGFTTNQITGYATGITGVTGILGYLNVATGSGVNAFGVMQYQYQPVAQTGYISSGLTITPLTGNVTNYITGDYTSGITLSTAKLLSLGYNEIAYTRFISTEDYSLASVANTYTASLDKNGSFDFVDGRFQLDELYTSGNVQIYMNGLAQFPSGYGVTGGFYHSGSAPLADYFIDGYYVDSARTYESTDWLIYDIISGKQERCVVSGRGSGAAEPIAVTGWDKAFFNGALLYSGLDFTVSGGLFRWMTNKYSGASGNLIVYSQNFSPTSVSGVTFNTFPIFLPGNTQVFLNGQRQRKDVDYVENATCDLILRRGNFETLPNSIYNNDDTFFE